MSNFDPFGRTDKLDDATLEALVVRFEARGKHPAFSTMLQNYLDAMSIDSTKTVLDLGCGTGLATRAIVHRPGFAGIVTGIDISSYLIEAGKQLARDEGIDEKTRFHTGDAQRLDFPEETFDAVVIHTLFSHVDDPWSVLKEAARVLKIGGLIGIFDGDYASLTFDNPDPVKGKIYDEALISAVVKNSRIMRQMPRLLRSAGLELVTSFAYVLAEVGTAHYWSSAIEAYRRLIPKSGVMTEDEANAWAAVLFNDSDTGDFFGSCNYYAYVARREG